jgi:L-asparaginase
MQRDSVTGALRPVRGHLTARLHTLLQSNPRYPAVTVWEASEPLDSSDMGPSDWADVANKIAENYASFDGFVVVMGTDTLAYCASALAFMLENLGKPVVVTGAMLPMDRGESDAPRNLLVSILVAAQHTLPEVVVFFRDQLLRGCRCKKLNAESMDAFFSPNFPALATVSTEMLVHTDLVLPPPRLPFRARTAIDGRVLALRLIPGFDDAPVLALLRTTTDELKALVLELYGAGNAPRKHGLVQAAKQAMARGVVVAVVSQCVAGWVDLEAYNTGVHLLEAGVLSAGDMTFEACAVKLGWLFGCGLSKTEVERQFKLNLRGEMTPVLKPEPRFAGDAFVVRRVGGGGGRL